MKKFSITTLLLLLFLTPSLALADVNNLNDLISQLQTLINNGILPLLFSIALLGFLVGVIRYIFAAGNPAKIKEARGFIVFSIIAIAVMLSVWSLALFVKNSFFPNAPAGINFGSGGASNVNNSTNQNNNNNNNNSNTGNADCSQEGSQSQSCGGGLGKCGSNICIYDCSQPGTPAHATCGTDGSTCDNNHQCQNSSQITNGNTGS